MSMITSASDRYEAARRALDLHESRSERATNAQMHLAEALRALITPPSVGESAEQIARRILEDFASREPFAAAGIGAKRVRLVKALVAEGVRAGIQAAWETWEPEAAPTIDDNADLIEDLRQIRDQRGDWRGVLDSLIGDDE